MNLARAVGRLRTRARRGRIDGCPRRGEAVRWASAAAVPTPSGVALDLAEGPRRPGETATTTSDRSAPMRAKLNGGGA